MTFDALTLFWILVAYLVGRIPFEATRRFRPFVRDDGRLFTGDEVQAAYDRRVPLLLIQQNIVIVFFLFWPFIVSKLGFPEVGGDPAWLLSGLGGISVLLATTYVLACLDRFYWD